MNPFTYSYPVKVYFGEKAAAKNLAAELARVGPNVLLAYGGGSIKKNGIYDELIRYGYYRYQADIMIVTVILLVALVMILHLLGSKIALAPDKRK